MQFKMSLRCSETSFLNKESVSYTDGHRFVAGWYRPTVSDLLQRLLHTLRTAPNFF